MSGMSGTSVSFVDMCNDARKKIKEVATHIKEQVEVTKNSEVAKGEDKGEKIANLMLTFRHLEDANMRLGKAIQAHDGGVSVYDKDTTVGA